MAATCGRCRVMPVETGEAWCVDCAENDDPADYIGGIPRWDAGLDADGQP